MFTASNTIARAMSSFSRRKIRFQARTRIQCYGPKSSKIKFYVTDQEYYRNVYLKSDHWKDLKQRKLQQNPVCEECKCSNYLDVHHINYKNLYDVELSDLKTLCRSDHAKLHTVVVVPKKKKRIRFKRKLFRKRKYRFKNPTQIINTVCRKTHISRNIVEYYMNTLIKNR